MALIFPGLAGRCMSAPTPHQNTHTHTLAIRWKWCNRMNFRGCFRYIILDHNSWASSLMCSMLRGTNFRNYFKIVFAARAYPAMHTHTHEHMKNAFRYHKLKLSPLSAKNRSTTKFYCQQYTPECRKTCDNRHQLYRDLIMWLESHKMHRANGNCTPLQLVQEHCTILMYLMCRADNSGAIEMQPEAGKYFQHCEHRELSLVIAHNIVTKALMVG